MAAAVLEWLSLATASLAGSGKMGEFLSCSCKK